MKSNPFALLVALIGSCLVHSTVIAAAPTTQASFDSNGVPIHYRVSGKPDGEPLVLIHGYAGNMDNPWAALRPALERDYMLIALDCRGHGASGKPHEPAQYGIEMVKDVVRLLDHLKIEKAHVAGYSMGAGIAAALAVHYPQRLKSVTLGGGASVGKAREKLIVAVAESLEQGNGFGPLLKALSPKDKPPAPEQIKLLDGVILRANDAKALAAAARGAILPETGLELSDAQLASISVPLQVLIGEQDPVRDEVDVLEKAHPSTHIVLIPASDHMSAWSKPQFLAALREFIEAHRGP